MSRDLRVYLTDILNSIEKIKSQKNVADYHSR